MLREINPFLNFDGQALEAIEHYKRALGAVEEVVMRWRDMPGDPVPPEMADRVMYSSLSVGGHHINLSDVPPGQELTGGRAFNVLLEFEQPEDLDRCFAALSEGGEVLMGVETTFWNARFGKLIDRFGVSWMFNCELGEEGQP